MASGEGTLIELRLEAEGISGRISYPPNLRPVPGQYLLASGPDPSDPLPTVLFPTTLDEDSLVAAAPLPAHWSTGMSLHLRGPLGHGFQIPPAVQRLALASLDGTGSRLLPLAIEALERNGSVVIYSHATPRGLPEAVEALPLELLPEAPAWADFLAIDAPISALPGLREQFKLKPHQRLACPAQVLVIAPMPCGGMAECGVCAVQTRGGWALACSDGPVFDFNVLEGG